MNQVTLSRFWYGCDNGMTDFVVSRSRWKFWSYLRVYQPQIKRKKIYYITYSVCFFLYMIRNKNSKSIPVSIYYHLVRLLYYLSLSIFLLSHFFHFDEFSTNEFELGQLFRNGKSESSLSQKRNWSTWLVYPSDRMDGQADRNFKIRKFVSPWQRGPNLQTLTKNPAVRVFCFFWRWCEIRARKLFGLFFRRCFTKHFLKKLWTKFRTKMNKRYNFLSTLEIYSLRFPTMHDGSGRGADRGTGEGGGRGYRSFGLPVMRWDIFAQENFSGQKQTERNVQATEHRQLTRKGERHPTTKCSTSRESVVYAQSSRAGC